MGIILIPSPIRRQRNGDSRYIPTGAEHLGHLLPTESLGPTRKPGAIRFDRGNVGEIRPMATRRIRDAIESVVNEP
jgi:hypothetical protein